MLAGPSGSFLAPSYSTGEWIQTKEKVHTLAKVETHVGNASSFSLYDASKTILHSSTEFDLGTAMFIHERNHNFGNTDLKALTRIIRRLFHHSQGPPRDLGEKSEMKEP